MQFLLAAGSSLFLSVLPTVSGNADSGKGAAVIPLRHAHAHNDYEHPRPLFDALERGYCSVEADVFLVGDQLQVAHTPTDLKRERTLERLYLVSGNRARDLIAAQPTRYAGIDGRAEDLDSDAPADLVPWISERWGAHFRWRGDGPMPDSERRKLQEFVRKSHRKGRLVRFWATPERPEVWKALLACDVDLIGTDDLARLEKFLREQGAPRRK